MNIERLYTRKVTAVAQSTTLREAAQLMRDRHIGCLLVTEKAPFDHRAIGIVTDRDIVVQAVAAGADPMETTIAEVMTSKIARVTHEGDAHEALAMMAALGVRRLAVTGDDGAIVGVLSFDDLVDGLAVEVADLARTIRTARSHEARPELSEAL